MEKLKIFENLKYEKGEEKKNGKKNKNKKSY